MLRNRKGSVSFQEFCEGIGKCKLNSDHPVLHSPAPTALCEASGLSFCIYHKHRATKASALVLTKMFSLLLCPQNPILVSVYSHLAPNADSAGSLTDAIYLLVNSTDLQAYF